MVEHVHFIVWYTLVVFICQKVQLINLCSPPYDVSRQWFRCSWSNTQPILHFGAKVLQTSSWHFLINLFKTELALSWRPFDMSSEGNDSWNIVDLAFKLRTLAVQPFSATLAWIVTISSQCWSKQCCTNSR